MKTHHTTLRGRLLAGALIAATSLAGGFASAAEPVAAAATRAVEKRPNFLIIVADDLGYSDLGAFGGEIETPNLDALAKAGVRLSGFHTAPTCSPTRSMLMTGSDNHQVGLGSMAEVLSPGQKGRPGYEGYLNDRSVTVAELLRDSGYRTLMAGKWHLGLADDQSPAARGFERSYALLQGLQNHFGEDQTEAYKAAGAASTFREDGKVVTYPKGVYSADFYGDKMAQFIREGAGDGRPFFAYLTFTEPHWPLQAPPETIAKYKGRYDAGYEALREQRLAKLKALGLVAKDVKPHPFVDTPAWSSLSPAEKKDQSRRMEIYAAMVDRMDQNIGKVVAALKASGQYDNTVIVFLSDNGAEGSRIDTIRGVPDPAKLATLPVDNSFDNLGAGSSHVGYGPGWAQAATAPTRQVKGYTTEGGIHTPAIVEGPGVKGDGRIVDSLAHVADVEATVLELAGVKRPETYRGRAVAPSIGRSWVAALSSPDAGVRGPQDLVAWELFFRRAVRQGDWKAIYLPSAPGGAAYSREAVLPANWQLFNLKSDPAEAVDLASSQPDKLKELVEAWNRYAAQNGVVLPPPQPAAGAPAPAKAGAR
ncbi:arylsulfatase [Caulobacter radicis]|uniref:arylsulfatase n=1 Tax=Caulobacter radicis TaxID=2172650 RepID=UPI000D5724FD|nr:arylsulfatase [Caulobacter radicis]PVM90504.1 arylsulfatase [Caulobacter radicis]